MTDKAGDNLDDPTAMSALQPLVSVIIPTREEGAAIDKCLDSILGNFYPLDRLEIIIVDGMSSDETREIVKGYMTRYPMIRLLDNPRKVTPTAMNIGIKNAHGDVIIMVNGHSYLAKDFIMQSVKHLQAHLEADCVGGTLQSVHETFIGDVIALAADSPFGAGGARYRTRKREGYTSDTVPYAAYRKEVFQRIGLIDEELIRDQDEEFNYRLIKKGGKIYYSPVIKSYLHTRSSFKKLFKQHFQYGYWKIRVLQKSQLTVSWWHLVPATFVFSLIGSGISAIWSLWGLYALGTISGSYLAASLLFSLMISAKKGWRYLPLLPLAFGTIHFGYGLGFLKGLWDFVILRKHLKRKIEDVELTR